MFNEGGSTVSETKVQDGEDIAILRSPNSGSNGQVPDSGGKWAE